LKRTAILIAAFALVLAACGGGGDEVAATVDGTDLTVSQVESLIDNGGEPIEPGALFAEVLTFSVIHDIVTRAAEEDFDITFTEEEIAAEADRIVEGELAEGQTREAFLQERGATEVYLLQAAEQSLVASAVIEAIKEDLDPPTQEEIDTEMEQTSRDLTEVCAAHILVATEEEAQAVVDRLEAGEEFANLAAELSTDTMSGEQGGDLGCQQAGGYVPEFATAALEAEIDVPTEPVVTEFGYHIILVNERNDAQPADLPTEDEVIDLLQNQAAGPGAQEWFDGRMADAEVVVTERFGTWEVEPEVGVIPPSAAPTTTTG
jgi:parvulin-like peptidyl-prolyl isomerase